MLPPPLVEVPLLPRPLLDEDALEDDPGPAELELTPADAELELDPDPLELAAPDDDALEIAELELDVPAALEELELNAPAAVDPDQAPLPATPEDELACDRVPVEEPLDVSHDEDEDRSRGVRGSEAAHPPRANVARHKATALLPAPIGTAPAGRHARAVGTFYRDSSRARICRRPAERPERWRSAG